MQKRTVKRRGSPLKAAGLGLLLSVGIILLLALAGGLLTAKGAIPEGVSGVIAAAAVFLAALLGPLPLLKAAGKRTLANVYLYMGGLLAVLAVCKLICWPGAAYGNWASLIAAPAGATVCGVVHLKRGRARR